MGADTAVGHSSSERAVYPASARSGLKAVSSAIQPSNYNALGIKFPRVSFGFSVAGSERRRQLYRRLAGWLIGWSIRGQYDI